MSSKEVGDFRRNVAPPGSLHKADHARIQRELERRLAEFADLSACRSGIETERQPDVFDEAQSMMYAELTVSRLNMAWRTRKAIEVALEKLNDGEYGLCGSCGEPIHPRRTEAIPWAVLCSSCQSLHEAGSNQEIDEPPSGTIVL